MEARKREITDLIKAVGIQNFDITLRNNGHYEIKSDELNRQIFTSSTPSDRRGNLNLKGDLRRELKAKLTNAVARNISFSYDEKMGILEEYKKSGKLDDLVSKYRISKDSLYKWADEAGIELRQAKTRVTAEQKNKVIKMNLDGLGGAEIARRTGHKISRVYGWIDFYKKNGFYSDNPKNKVKEIAKQNLENNKSVSHLNSGKKSESTQQSADFENAISIISAAPLRIKELEQLLAERELEISDLKTKLEVVKEALAL